MQKEHEVRVKEEFQQLNDKIKKLGEFIHGAGDGLYGNIYRTLPKNERMLLVDQLCAMGEYADILQQRMDKF